MDQVRERVEGLIDQGDYLGAFQALLSEGATPELAPTLWERLGSAARDGGADSLAHQVFMSLWDADFGSTVVALDLARDRFQDGRYRDAAHFLTETFGHEPEDTEARALLAEIQLSIAPEETIRLTQELWMSDVRAAIVRIDAFRELDQLRNAQDAIEAAQRLFPTETRLTIREARTKEALGDWSGALSAWQQLADKNAEPGANPKAQIVRLQMRFERPEAALDSAAVLLASPLPAMERLRIADLLDQTPMFRDVLETALREGVSDQDGRAIARTLRAQGQLGALAWMAGRGLPMPGQLRRALEKGLAHLDMRDLQAGPLDRAMRLRSPDCLFPISKAALRSFRASGHPLAGTGGRTRLIVNATLAAGGAERQFVMLARALKRTGVPHDQIHLAVFSLVQDRGHAHFLSALEEEGLTIHHLRSGPRMSADAAGALSPVLTLLPDPLRNDVLALLPLAMRLDPVLLHGWQDRSGLACGVVGMILGTERVIMSSRNMRPDRRGDSAAYGGRLYRQLLGARPGFTLTANSAAGAKDYADWVGVPAQAIPVIGNALEISRFPAPTRAAGTTTDDTKPLTIGGVFRLAANKRPELWLQTIGALRQHLSRPLRIKLVGRGPYEARVRAMAADLGLHDIELSAGLSDPQDIYGGMDVLLLMSRVEGTPNVLLEAQACGLPVAACDVGGVQQAVCTDAPGRGLILSETISPEDAAAEIARWLPMALTSDGAEARRSFIESRYGIDALKDAVGRICGVSGH